MDGRNEGPPSASAEIGKLLAARGQRIKELKAQLEAQQAINAAQFRDRVKLEERIKELEECELDLLERDIKADEHITKLEDKVKFLQWMESFDSGFRSTILMAYEEYEALNDE